MFARFGIELAIRTFAILFIEILVSSANKIFCPNLQILCNVLKVALTEVQTQEHLRAVAPVLKIWYGYNIKIDENLRKIFRAPASFLVLVSIS